MLIRQPGPHEGWPSIGGISEARHLNVDDASSNRPDAVARWTDSNRRNGRAAAADKHSTLDLHSHSTDDSLDFACRSTAAVRIADPFGPHHVLEHSCRQE